MGISKVLSIKEIHVNRKRVVGLMRELKLYPKGTRYRYKNYNKR